MIEPEGDPPPINTDEVLRSAQAPWQRDGLGVRGQPTTFGRQPDPPPEGRWPLKIEKQEETQPFPPQEPVAEQASEETDEGQAEEYAFQLRLKSIDKDTGTVSVLVNDGEINSEFPSGMTGADDYVLNLTVPGSEIWAVITYDTDTLEITSRTLDFGASVPDSTLGTLYVPIGYVNWNVDGDGNISDVLAHNRHCGDIDFGFIYGSMNGEPALFTLAQYGSPQFIPTD